MKIIDVLDIFKKDNFCGLPESLNSAEMRDFILNNKLSDSKGILDYTDAHLLAYSADDWVLTELDLDTLTCDVIVNPEYVNNTQIPPIVLNLGDDEFEIMDGRYKIGLERLKGNKSILVYLGEI